MTTKILALTDALGNLVRFVLMPGHRFDTVGVAPLIDGLAFDGFIADKAFDSNSIIADLNERGAKIVISQHPRRAVPLPIDAEINKWRHLIEISSVSSRNSNASQCARTKPIRASRQTSISPQPSLIPDESQQTLDSGPFHCGPSLYSLAADRDSL
jgi:transposase